MNRVRLVVLIGILISSIFILGTKKAVVIKEHTLENYPTHNLLRLHVIANSNSLEDQKIKRVIRNEIIEKTSGLFISLKNPKEAKIIVNNNILRIEEIIKRKLKEYGKEYKIKLELGKFDFPKRSYGNSTLKEGEYEALRVILGKGKGENWWCVLFPPLCFVDSMEEVSAEELKDLAKEERIVKDNEMNIEFRFKIIESLKENPQFVKSKMKLFNILESSFPDLNKLLFSIEKENN